MSNINPCRLALLFIILAVLLGCDGKNPTAPSRVPSAFFTVTIQEITNSFIVRFFNQSRNSQEVSASQASNLRYDWRFQDKGTDTALDPTDRVYIRLELGLAIEGDSATRQASLTVIEDNDTSKQSTHNETLVFVQSAASVVVVGVLVKDYFGRTVEDQATAMWPPEYDGIVMFRESGFWILRY